METQHPNRHIKEENIHIRNKKGTQHPNWQIKEERVWIYFVEIAVGAWPVLLLDRRSVGPLSDEGDRQWWGSNGYGSNARGLWSKSRRRRCQSELWPPRFRWRRRLGRHDWADGYWRTKRSLCAALGMEKSNGKEEFLCCFLVWRE